MCGATMRLKPIEHVVQVPGDPTPVVDFSCEWNCPDCDYFEEAEDEGT
jgi:hypothetical protein